MKQKLLFPIVITVTLLALSLPMNSSAAKEVPIMAPPVCRVLPWELANNPAFIKSLPLQCQNLFEQKVSLGQKITTQAALLSSAGPDEFGYTYDDTVPFNWISAPTGNGITGGDDFFLGPVNIGGGLFTFPFYGQNHSTLFISTNGLITFDLGSCCDYGGITIPTSANPNNFIAPFLDDLVVGNPYNAGAVWYATGGVAPNRYFMVEWRDVTTASGSDPFSFEVILYENGDILVQHQSLPATYYSTVGIENATGDDGLGYQSGDIGLSAPKAIKFIYPTTPTARVSISPLHSSTFASDSLTTPFPIHITNIGTLGTDTYNLSATSSWTVHLHQYDAFTDTIGPLLTDTNADTIIDTGPIPQGGFKDIAVVFTPPSGLSIGDSNSASLIVSSSLDPAKSKTATMDMVIPAPFAQVLKDISDYAMLLLLNGPGPFRPLISFVTDINYDGFNPAIIDLPGGQYLYAWSKFGAGSFTDIEYTIVSHDGMNIDLPVTKLTDNTGADGTNDWAPSLAALPDGTIGIAWERHLTDNTNDTFNENIYFATLSSTGSLLYGPVNLTNNTIWGTYRDITVPLLEIPSIAATDDNHFIVSWEETRSDGVTYNSNVWYTTLDSSGTTIYAPTQFTTDDINSIPVLNPLKNGNAILTWDVANTANYAILNSSGAIVKSATPLDHSGLYVPFSDAVRLPNGNIAIASATSSGVALTILDDQYNRIAGPTYASVPNASTLFELSTTYDSSNHIILTWIDGDFYPATNMYYAMADSTGTFLTDPMIFKSSNAGIETSFYGQGIAPHIDLPTTLPVSIDIKPGSTKNPISMKSKGKIPVAILSTSNFNALLAVNKSTLTFGKTGEENSLAFCSSIGSDVNGDGLADLICNFYAQKTDFASGNTTGFLKGKTVDNISLEGNDVVTILK